MPAIVGEEHRVISRHVDAEVTVGITEASMTRSPARP
jgi:hypothetical protein